MYALHKSGLKDLLVRQCKFGLTGPQSKLLSNKVMRVLSSLDIGADATRECRCGTHGLKHFEDKVKDMSEVRKLESKNWPMRTQFLKGLVLRVREPFLAGSSPPLSFVVDGRCRGTHPEYSTGTSSRTESNGD